MFWLITAGVLVLLAVLPLGVSAAYDEGGPLVRLIAGPIRIQVYPAKPKKEKSKDQKPKKTTEKKQEKKKTEEKPAEKKGGSVRDFLPLVSPVLEFLNDFRRKLRVNQLQLRVILAGDDPCDLAVNYGKAWAALGNLMPQLERVLVIQKRDVEVECDFISNQTLIVAKLDLTITLGRLLAVSLYHGVRILWQFLIIMKTRKGGAKL
jgi:hypothetical protein